MDTDREKTADRGGWRRMATRAVSLRIRRSAVRISLGAL